LVEFNPFLGLGENPGKGWALGINPKFLEFVSKGKCSNLTQVFLTLKFFFPKRAFETKGSNGEKGPGALTLGGFSLGGF